MAILKDLCDFCVLKQPQVCIAIDWLLCNVSKTLENRKSMRAKLTALKKSYATVPILRERLTDAYISGLNDAEGSIRTNKKSPILIIAQKSCPNILTAITEVKRCGSVIDKREFVVCGDNGKKMTQALLPWSIVKRRQMELILEWRMIQERTLGKQKAPEDRAKMDELQRECKRLKKSS